MDRGSKSCTLRRPSNESFAVGARSLVCEQQQQPQTAEQHDESPDSSSAAAPDSPTLPGSPGGRATISVSTAQIAKLPYQVLLIDTPGLANHAQFFDCLTPEELALVRPGQGLKAEMHALNPGQTLMLGGLARVDYEKGTFFGANNQTKKKKKKRKLKHG